MTYDPLSYGQIKLKDKAEAPGESPEDLLFADAGPSPQSAVVEGGASDWELPDSEHDSRGPMASGVNPDSDFGADVLGESLEPAPAPVAAAPAPVAEPRVVPKAKGPRPSRRHQQPVPSQFAEEPVEQAPATRAPVIPTREPVSKRPRRSTRPPRWVGTLVPSVAVACGGSASAWFYMMEQNVIMAGIVGAISLVGAALTRVMFR